MATVHNYSRPTCSSIPFYNAVYSSRVYMGYRSNIFTSVGVKDRALSTSLFVPVLESPLSLHLQKKFLPFSLIIKLAVNINIGIHYFIRFFLNLQDDRKVCDMYMFEKVLLLFKGAH